ncbi:MAG: hypothetical protein RSB10_06425, partial [Clostridia bacterium]
LAASFIDFLCQGIRRAPLVSSSCYFFQLLGWTGIHICIFAIVDANHFPGSKRAGLLIRK